jgi:hypothetical protein
MDYSENIEFQEFRRGLIDYIYSEINQFIQNDKLSYKFIYILHGAFITFKAFQNKIINKLDDFSFTFEPYFKYYFYSSLFITLKVLLNLKT